jgi:prepilin-type N-terminal cleavage/methylation domain-containing protein
MRNNNWFTLIELLIVVTIIAIMWTFSFLSFGNFFDKYEYGSYQKRIDNYLDIEDFNIKNNVNSSYEITFLSWSPGYTVSKNFFKPTNFVKLDNFDFASLSWTFTTSAIWDIYYNNDYWNWRIITAYFSGSSNIISLKEDYNWSSKINILFTLNWVNLNNYDIVFFESDILRGDTITSISSLSGANLYDKVTYSNILWKKEIKWFWGANSWSINEVYINLEKWSKEIPIKLTK